MKLQKVAIVCNKNAGGAKGKKLELLVAAFEAKGIAVLIFPTTPEPNSARLLTIDAQSWGADLIVAFGGDYTVNQVALGLMSFAPHGRPTPMAVFPAGTGNLFSRSFYSVPSAERFVKICLTGRVRDVDAICYVCDDLEGKQHKGILLVALGFGDLSDAIALSDQKLKRRFGPSVYALNVAKAAAGFKPHKVTLRFTNEGEEELKATLLSGFVFNVLPPKVGAFSRGCNASDHLLDFVGFSGATIGELLTAARMVLSGRPDESDQYLRLVTDKLTIESDRPMLLNLDGDAGPTTKKVELSVLPGAVRLLVG